MNLLLPKTLFLLATAGCTLASSALRAETLQDAQGVIYAYSDASATTCYVQGHTDALARAVTIPATMGGRAVTRIGDGAFFGCTALSSVTLGDSLRSIGYGAFYGCTALTAVSLPPALRLMEAYAFASCTALADLDLGTGLSAVGDDVFAGCSSLRAVTLPPQVDSLAFRAFADCDALTSVRIGAGLRFIDPYAFAGCTALTDLAVSDGNAAYHTADQGQMLIHSESGTLHAAAPVAAALDVPVGVRRIRESLGYGAGHLTEVVLPDGIEQIDLFAFADCAQLQTVTTYSFQPCPIDESVFQTYDSAFMPTDATYARATLFVPTGTRRAYEAAAGWSRFGHIEEFDVIAGIERPQQDARPGEGTVRYFSPDGSPRLLPTRGLNIILHGDGSAEKVWRTE